MFWRGISVGAATLLTFGACAGGSTPDDENDTGATTTTTAVGTGGATSAGGGSPAGTGGAGGVEDPCEPGYADCDGQEGNGCEIYTVSHAQHCGMCNNPCAVGMSSTAQCVDSMCEVTCNQGFENCDANPDCETQLATDPMNCGECGEVCPGTCTAGVCDPVVLASGQDNPLFLTQDATNLYWTNAGSDPGNNATDGSVVQAPKAGGTPTVLVSSVPFPTQPAVDTTHVYFGTYGTAAQSNNDATLQKVPIGGGAPVQLATGSSISAVVVDATHAYFVNGGASPAFSDGSIARVPIGGGAVETLVSGLLQPWSILLDGSDVIFSTIDLPNSSGSIQRVAKTGGTPTVIAANQAAPYSLHKDATDLYFSLWVGNGVYTVPLAGGTPTFVASAANAFDIALDGTDVFFGSLGSAGVSRVPTMGGTPEVIYTHPMGAGPYGVEADANNVYWTATNLMFTLNSGQILYAPR